MNTNEAIAHLRASGYVVIPRERRVVLQQRSILSPMFEFEGRYLDYCTENMAAKIGLHMLEAGLMIRHEQEWNDPHTGPEATLSLACAVIKPKEIDDPLR